MSEHKSPIPGRIYNAAVGGHVCGTEDIIDDNKNKTQKQINSELEESLGTGGSVDLRIASAVAAEASRAQTVEEQLRQAYEALSQSQPIPVTELPATGEAGKIYRLAGTTSYTDYMYAEEALTTPIKMAEYDNAIDNKPIAGSNNLVKSGGVEQFAVTTYQNISASNYQTYLPGLALSGLPKNSISYISNDITQGTTKITDLPSTVNSAWIVETISGYSNTAFAVLQRAYCVAEKATYIRYSANGSTFDSWGRDDVLKTYGAINQANYGTMLPSLKLSDLPRNIVSYISPAISDNISDIPLANNSAWIIESISGWYFEKYSILQKAYCVDTEEFYTRYSANGASYSNWKNIKNEIDAVTTYSHINANNYSTTLPSLKLSDLPRNSISYISDNISDSILDIPAQGSAWVIESVSGYGGLNYAILQKAYSVLNAKTYTRYSGNGTSYSGWNVEGQVALPLYDLSAFKKVGACGDSYTRGSLYKANGTWAGYRPDLAWTQVLSRKHGFDCNIFAFGGVSTAGFINNPICLPKLLNSERMDLYLLFLGINDAITYGTDSSYLGTIEDIHQGSPDQNPNTFYGNYGKIIEAIQEYAPASLQIMMTVKFIPAHETNIQVINTAIKAIATLYGIPCIDMYNTPAYNSSVFTSSLQGGHPTPILHSAIAKQIDNSFYDCVLNNTTYFNNYSTKCLSNGTFAERPEADVTIAGYVYWDSTNECLWECNGVGTNVDWIKIFEIKKEGNTSDRPSNAPIGTCYYDETIGKPIWWNGTLWIDATGTSV